MSTEKPEKIDTYATALAVLAQSIEAMLRVSKIHGGDDLFAMVHLAGFVNCLAEDEDGVTPGHDLAQFVFKEAMDNEQKRQRAEEGEAQPFKDGA